MTPSIIPVALLAAAMTIPAASFASNANGDSKLSGNATPNNATAAANDTLVNRVANGTEPKQGAFAEIRGQITDNNGNPINEATITVKGMKRAVRTKANGKFILSELPSGETTILVHAIGYTPQQRTLKLSNNKSYEGIDFVLQERSDALPTVDVMGRREQSYKNSVSFVGTKTATALKDVPQSIGYVTKELVLDQGAITVNDVVKNISGISQYSAYNDFSIRGFRSLGNLNSGNLLNGMRGLTPLWRQSSLANIERVEVIKGPASALFGNAAPGGVVNRVTKKPLDVARRSVTLTAGSFNTSNVYGDFTGPLNEKKSLLYRLNLGYENTDGFRDLQGLTTFIVAPSFTYILSDRTQLNADITYNNNMGKLDRGLAIHGDGDLFSVPFNSTQSAASDFMSENTFNLSFALSHQLAKGLLFNSTYLYSSYLENTEEHAQQHAYQSTIDGKQDFSKVEMRFEKRHRHITSNNFNNYLTWDVATGALKHKLLLGYDYFNTAIAPGLSSLSASGYLLKNGTVVDKFDVKKKDDYQLDASGNPRTNVPSFDLNSTLGNRIQDISKYIYKTGAGNPNGQGSAVRSYSNGVYLQEQLRWGRLQTLLSARVEWFTDVTKNAKGIEKKTTQTAFIPRVGLVYELTPSTNVYASWIRGFEPQSVAIQSDPETGGPFDPMKSELWEVGAKGEYLNKRLSVTTSVFRIRKNNSLYSAGDPVNPKLRVAVGEEVSRGVEFDVSGRILPYWSITANYSYNIAEITKAAPGTKDLNIQRPGTPRHAANLWTKFIIPSGALRNLGMGLGINGVSAREGQVGRRAQLVTYPGYTLLNLALYYKVRDMQLQLNWNNVLNKQYYISGFDRFRSFPGAPSNINLTATYRF
jgi:tonB-dependent siderophore receptor